MSPQGIWEGNGVSPAAGAKKEFISGIIYTGQTAPEPPMLLIQGAEKSGKSSLAITLSDWPTPGMQPLVLAFDTSGPESCARLGYQIPVLRVGSERGTTYFEKTLSALTKIEEAFARRDASFPFSSLVVDCGSTMTGYFLRDAKKAFKHGKRVYGEVLDKSMEVLWRLRGLGVPLIWLSWLREAFVDEETKRQILGGPLLDGSFKAKLAGMASNIITLEKFKVGQGAQGADRDGFARRFRTRPHDKIDCGGRFHLPDPCPPHLGYVVDIIMGRVQLAETSEVQQPTK